MADDILSHSPDAPPPLDTVLLWLTMTVERDYIARDAFPRLRISNVRGYRGSSGLHYLTPDEASAVLADALDRRQGVAGPMKKGYTELIRGLQQEIAEAEERPALYKGVGPAKCTFKCEYSEGWRGTKGQLVAHGIQLDGPWEPEGDGRERRREGKDSRGYIVTIYRVRSIWSGLYEASISLPLAEPKPQVDEQSKEADRAHRNLAEMPDSADAYRAHVVNVLRGITRQSLEIARAPARWHGYTLDEGAIDEIHAAFDGLAEAIAGARVNFDAKRHEEIAQQYRAKIAAADRSFQAKIAGLVKPNAKVFEGGAQ